MNLKKSPLLKVSIKVNVCFKLNKLDPCNTVCELEKSLPLFGLPAVHVRGYGNYHSTDTRPQTRLIDIQCMRLIQFKKLPVDQHEEPTP